jgi:hypothetical protein
MENGVSFGESAVTASRISSNQIRTSTTTQKHNSYGDNPCYTNAYGVQDRSITKKQPVSREMQDKPASSYELPQQDVPGIDTNSERHKRKVKSAFGYNKDLDNDDNNNATTDLPPPQRTQKDSPKLKAKKRPRLIINSDPFTPSPPNTPVPSRSPTPAEEDEDFDHIPSNDTDEEYNEHQTPRTRRKQQKQKLKRTPTKPRSTRPKLTRKAKATAKAKNPSSASKRSASAKNRNYSFPVARTISAATEADKVMFRMKGEGKSWKDITAEWTRLTGRQPGTSSLSVRYIKLKEKFAKMGGEDVSFNFFYFCQVCFCFVWCPVWQYFLY